ncbi:universal stress protein [Salmonella enterica subsp. enterica]|nr:universal stress protein [Salmonella enterica subsp. enterica serovar Enteritidis]
MRDIILVPSDGSFLAEKGVDKGLELARERGAKVIAVTVTEPFGGQFGFASELWSPSDAELAQYDAQQEEAAMGILSPIAEKARAIGVEIEIVHIPNRLVAASLAELAEQRCCSAIVMASHGRTGINRALHGSQTSAVLSNSKVPVIVAR